MKKIFEKILSSKEEKKKKILENIKPEQIEGDNAINEEESKRIFYSILEAILNNKDIPKEYVSDNKFNNILQKALERGLIERFLNNESFPDKYIGYFSNETISRIQSNPDYQNIIMKRIELSIDKRQSPENLMRFASSETLEKINKKHQKEIMKFIESGIKNNKNIPEGILKLASKDTLKKAFELGIPYNILSGYSRINEEYKTIAEKNDLKDIFDKALRQGVESSILRRKIPDERIIQLLSQDSIYYIKNNEKYQSIIQNEIINYLKNKNSLNGLSSSFFLLISEKTLDKLRQSKEIFKIQSDLYNLLDKYRGSIEEMTRFLLDNDNMNNKESRKILSKGLYDRISENLKYLVTYCISFYEKIPDVFFNFINENDLLEGLKKGIEQICRGSREFSLVKLNDCLNKITDSQLSKLIDNFIKTSDDINSFSQFFIEYILRNKKDFEYLSSLRIYKILENSQDFLNFVKRNKDCQDIIKRHLEYLDMKYNRTGSRDYLPADYRIFISDRALEEVERKINKPQYKYHKSIDNFFR